MRERGAKTRKKEEWERQKWIEVKTWRGRQAKCRREARRGRQVK